MTPTLPKRSFAPASTVYRDGNPLALMLLERTEQQIQVFETGIRDVVAHATAGERDARMYNVVSALLVVSVVGRVAEMFTPVGRARARFTMAKETVERTVALYGKAEKILAALSKGAPDETLFTLVDVVKEGECARQARTSLTKLISEWRALKDPSKSKELDNAFAWGKVPLNLLVEVLSTAARCSGSESDAQIHKQSAKGVKSVVGVVDMVRDLTEAYEVNKSAEALKAGIGRVRDHQLGNMRERLTALRRQRAYLIAELDGSRSSKLSDAFKLP